MRDIAHEDGVSFLEYAYSATDTQIRSGSEGEKVAIVRNTFQGAMRLPEAKQWEAASDKKIESLRACTHHGDFCRDESHRIPVGV